MKNIFPRIISLLTLVLSLQCLSAENIVITTDSTALAMTVGPNGRLYQTWLGPRLAGEADYGRLNWQVTGGSDGTSSPRGWEVYPGSGAEDYYEPALAVTHPDGSLTTILQYVGHSTETTPYGTRTVITLRDDLKPVEVKLYYDAYYNENVIVTHSVIKNLGKKPVELWRYASAMLYFNAPEYYLVEFASDWAREAQMKSERLQRGKKVIDTKLGSRSALFMEPFFELGIGNPVNESSGTVIMGTLAWTGNYSFTFEVDHLGNLRVIPSINPYASEWTLAPGEEFVTPDFIFTLSTHGTGQGSRDLHDWARQYRLKDGMGDRMTLLNNWENTYFNFDEALLRQLMLQGKDLGVDLFLLDDGWFGNKYPRSDDRSGLGDWQPTASKLPGGITALSEAADSAGIKFGIWIEPEMVNPKSALYEKHPDWAYSIPGREPYLYRNQMVLDLNNPRVQDHVFTVVDSILTAAPGVAYFKWDCNSPLINIHSPYLGKNQKHLYIGHVRGLYKVLDRIRAKYPDIPMMLCSGGGGRCDYGALQYFTEFWPSDNTDPIERLYIQWGMSQFFPAKAMAAHVTDWRRDIPVKFRTDVASMGKLGFDIGLDHLSPSELAFMRQAITNWRQLNGAILHGDQYRLLSPYDSEHTATMYVDKDRHTAALFAFDIYPRLGEKVTPLLLQGLDPKGIYRVEEINLMPEENADGRMVIPRSTLKQNGQMLSGDYLMRVGLDVFSDSRLRSHVIRLTKAGGLIK